jgi:hypothetical protein
MEKTKKVIIEIEKQANGSWRVLMTLSPAIKDRQDMKALIKAVDNEMKMVLDELYPLVEPKGPDVYWTLD